MKYRHGLTNTRLYRIWRNMKSRCNNPKTPHYEYYGGKGIKVCSEWNDFINFYNWSIQNGYNDNLTIDRIDNNRNYEPNNCKWSTYKEQNAHLPSLRKIYYNNQYYSIMDIVNMTGLTYKCISARYERGWSIDEILNTPKITKLKINKDGTYAITRISKGDNK